jgi:hypothetical protein
VWFLGLGGNESLATLQADSLVSWRDEAAKRTHPLRSYFRDRRCQYRQQLSEHVTKECQPSAEAAPEREKNGFHRSCFLPLLGNCLPQGISGRSHRKRPHLRKRRPAYDDRSRQAILYRIAHIPPGVSGVATTFCECAHVPQNCSLLTILVPWLPSTISAYLPRRK